ncbi:hypothetical protein F2Q68_00015555 [Brassica cretica]|uniref:Uncharacterized protein n=1 Tax=Brassica cretica TaxID=69181 RepID=A0A8S9HN48_BRACR|nr:hypothetical protein F2Q68_00015555 [Brassica cretica]
MRRTTGMQGGKSPCSVKIHGNHSETSRKDSRATNLNAPTMAIQSRNSLIPFTEETGQSGRGKRNLSGWTDANPKCQVNAVLLRSGKHLIPRAIEINNTGKHAVVEETGESRSRPINLDDPNTESEIPRERGKPNTEEEAIELEEEEGEIEEDAEID